MAAEAGRTRASPGASVTSASRPTAHLSLPAASASLRSRHSLYGTEDRVVLDLGSRVWKVGFSGEAAPRVCGFVDRTGGQGELWNLSSQGEPGEAEGSIRLERLKRGLRDVFFNHLMTDSKTRKVLIVEPPLLPTPIKNLIAKLLFENLKVPSLNFASGPVLALMAMGTLTGIVVDVGHLETTVLPVFASRPLFPLLVSTPRAGSSLTTRLQRLLSQFGTYAPPPTSVSNGVRVHSARGTGIPASVLTDDVLEMIKTRSCYVLQDEAAGGAGNEMDVDQPFLESESDESRFLRALERTYAPRSTASAITIKLPNAPSSFPVFAAAGPKPSRAPDPTGVGKGWIHFPGWVREAAAESLFEGGDRDQKNVVEAVMECLLKLPIDLRKPMASSIVISGGTACLPGFIPRFRHSLQLALARALEEPAAQPPSSPPLPPLPPQAMETDNDGAAPKRRKTTQKKSVLEAKLRSLRQRSRYYPVGHLGHHITILNDPGSHTSSSAATASSASRENAGRGPSFNPALLSWVGGSLAGLLKTGGEEVTRERWDEGRTAAVPAVLAEGQEEEKEEHEDEKMDVVLPDWINKRMETVMA